ncbi:MAG TPA: TonB-dependent receptor [Blastocatellia bacterium]|nr:TonB-dependent receptor [Blastocatellia bacterium]
MTGISALVPASVWGQAETGQITGKVVDAAGAAVPGAKVTVKSTATGLERVTMSGSEGGYSVTNLQPGIYSLVVSAQGFSTSLRQQIQVTVGSKISLEIMLTITTVSDNVVEIISASGVEVNTQTQELSNVVSGKQLSELPTLTRNPYDLVRLSANVARDSDDPNPMAASSTNFNGVGVAINGQRSASTNILLDGADNNDTFAGTVGQTVPLDAVQEFRVITSNFSAEYGRASGGIVNVATKSGTNEYHGTAYEFNRVDALAANGYDNNAKGQQSNFTRNQFGYSIGGPVFKDKLLFFNSTEFTRVRSAGDVTNVVPTPQLIAASHSNTQAFFNAFSLARPINGQVFTVSQIDPGGAGAFSALDPNLPAFGETKFSIPSDQGGGLPQNSYQTVIRADYNLNEKTQIYGRFARDVQTQFAGGINYSPYAGFDTGQTFNNNNILFSFTRTLSPSIVSQSKVVYNRLTNFQPLGTTPAGPTLFLTAIPNQTLQGSLLSLPGYSQFNIGAALPFGGPQNLTQLFEDLSYARGKHLFRFGGQYIYIQDNRAFGAFQNAAEQLGTTVADGLNNFVLGQLQSFQGGVDPQGKFPGDTITLPVKAPDFTRSNRYQDFALYANDSYRIKPRLTLNLGVRYEYFGVQHNSDPSKDSNFYLGPGASLQEQIRNGSVQVAPNSPVGGLYAPDRNNFAPRIGFAYDLFGDGKTSIRGGYGIAYERNFGNVTFNVIQNPPNNAVISLVAGQNSPPIPITTSNAGPLGGNSGTAVIPTTSLRFVRSDIRTAYASFYSVAFEREIRPRVVASLEYSGSTGRKLYSLEDFNRNGFGTFYLGSTVPTPPALMQDPTDRLNGQYTAINQRGNGGFSRYNSLVASIDSSNIAGLGLQFTAKYTYAVSRDNLSSTFSNGQGGCCGLGLLDPFNPALDYGHSDFDIRNQFVGSFNWELPYAKGTSGLTKQFLDGWSMAGIFTARTGTPFTVFDCSNAISVCTRLIPTAAFSTRGADNPAGVMGQPNRNVFIDLSNQTPGGFTDISGGTEVGPFPANLTGRNLFRAPGNWNLDGGVYKKFSVAEKYDLQFRAELYNLFNHANMFVSGSEAEISSSSFVPSFRSGRRNVQLALKFLF